MYPCVLILDVWPIRYTGVSPPETVKTQSSAGICCVCLVRRDDEFFHARHARRVKATDVRGTPGRRANEDADNRVVCTPVEQSNHDWWSIEENRCARRGFFTLVTPRQKRDVSADVTNGLCLH